MSTSTDLKTFIIAKGTKAQITQAYSDGVIGDTDFAIATDENYSARNVGEIVSSTLPLTDAGLHLLDGSLISGGGIYDEFVQYVAGLVSDYPDLFVTEASWQAAVSANGVCGKFVYDSSGDGSVRLPKITGIIEGTTSVSALGDLVAAGLPNITGGITGDQSNMAYRGDTGTGALYTEVGAAFTGTSNAASRSCGVFLDASLSNSIYGNSNTVQPQSIKVLYYIVIATATKTEIESDIDQIATDLNGKADKDLGNLSVGLANTICTIPATTTSTASSATPAVIVENYKNGTDWYRLYSDGWCEQGGTVSLNQGASNVLKTFSLLKSFANTDYYVSRVPVSTGTTDMGTSHCFFINTKETNQFKAYCGYSTIVPTVIWMACGYTR